MHFCHAAERHSQSLDRIVWPAIGAVSLLIVRMLASIMTRHSVEISSNPLVADWAAEKAYSHAG